MTETRAQVVHTIYSQRIKFVAHLTKGLMALVANVSSTGRRGTRQPITGNQARSSQSGWWPPCTFSLASIYIDAAWLAFRFNNSQCCPHLRHSLAWLTPALILLSFIHSNWEKPFKADQWLTLSRSCSVHFLRRIDRYTFISALFIISFLLMVAFRFCLCFLSAFLTKN